MRPVRSDMTPPSATPRAVVDTNLIVSGVILARGNPHALLAAWREGAFHLIFSTKQYVELVDVLSCPKLVERYGLEADELAALFDGLSAIPRIESIAPLPLIVKATHGWGHYRSSRSLSFWQCLHDGVSNIGKSNQPVVKRDVRQSF